MQYDRTRIKTRTHRLIASRFPTIGVFDSLVETEEELQVAFLLEQATNPRVLIASERLTLFPKGTMVLNESGASIAMAAFIHCDDHGGRFNDGKLGAWYAALEIETAIAETSYHHERRLRMSEGIFPATIQMRELISDLDLECVDLRPLSIDDSDLYSRADYSASQVFSNSIRWPNNIPGEDGIVYSSVRKQGGQNVCVFRPRAIGFPIVQGSYFQYMWDADGKISVSNLAKI